MNGPGVGRRLTRRRPGGMPPAPASGAPFCLAPIAAAMRLSGIPIAFNQAAAATQRGCQPADPAAGRQRCCVPDRPEQSRTGGRGASPHLALHSLRERNLGQLRPVINRQDAWNGRPVSAAVGFSHQPQQCIRAGRQGQPLDRTPAGLAAQRQSEMTLELAQALSALCEGPGDIGQRLGKGLAGAGRIETTKTARLHAQHRRLTQPGQIAERALIVAVDAPGNDGTARARR